MTYDQWTYFHKNITFLVIILIFKYVLFRLMQKYLNLVISFFLCCVNWYSCGVIRSSHRIRTRSHLIRIVVNFTTILCGYGTDPLRCGIILHWRSSNENSHKKKIIVNNKWFTFASTRFGCRIHVNQPLKRIRLRRNCSIAPFV